LPAIAKARMPAQAEATLLLQKNLDNIDPREHESLRWSF
jgi:hypothetical protein